MPKKEKFTLRLSFLDENEEWLTSIEEDFPSEELADDLFQRLSIVWNNREKN